MDSSKDSIEVCNLNDFIAIINSENLRNYYYRGENKQYPCINSSLLRNSKSMFSRNYFYENLVKTYYEEIAINISEFERSNFLAFSQHHGLATNLIDFTTSPLVALYFACEKTTRYTEKDIGYVYLIDQSKTLDASELINDIFSPHKSSYNIIDFFIKGDKAVINYLRQHLSLYFWEHDISPFTQDVYKCCHEIANSFNGSKTFIDEYDISIDEAADGFDLVERHAKLIKKFFPNLNSNSKSTISINLTLYLTMLYIYFIDLSGASFHILREKDFSFPKMPYFIYKTPYKFDRIRNQEGIFLYQLYKTFALKNEDVIDNIAIQKINPDITIKVHDQKKILDQLDFIGINLKYIYGDYDNIAQYFNEKYFL